MEKAMHQHQHQQQQQQPVVKSKNLFMRFLPKAATSSVNFNNPTYSDPNREKTRSHAHRGFSGPFIPVEARRRQSTDDEDTSFGRREDPKSPKVSCMGQIKQKHKLQVAKRASSKKEKESKVFNSGKKKQTSSFVRIFSSKNNKKKNDNKKSNKKVSNSSANEKKEEEEFGDDSTARRQTKTVPPSTLGQIKKFASTREAFANFDWTAQITPVNTDNPEDRNCYSDDEMNHNEEENEEVDEFMIPFSAPMLIGGNNKLELEPRKEINLWKRRTMVPPRPLNMNAPIQSK